MIYDAFLIKLLIERDERGTKTKAIRDLFPHLKLDHEKGSFRGGQQFYDQKVFFPSINIPLKDQPGTSKRINHNS